MPIKNSRGIALIEVLVTSVIIAIGLSGTAALLMKSVQSTNDSAQRSVGLWIIQDYIGRIRANREGALSGGYVLGNTNQNCESLPGKICADSLLGGQKRQAQFCSAGEMATFDNWITVCGIDNDVIDSASEAVKDPQLVSTCIHREPRGKNPQGDCIKYNVTLTWQAQVEQSQAGKMTQQMSYSQVVELN